MRTVPALYLTSYALSLLGNSIAAVALPLLLLQSTGSLASAGILALATAVPAFLAGLLLGVVVDRVDRRAASVVSDLISAAAIAALPIVDQLGDLTLGWFVLFGVLGAVGDVPGMTAREALLPAVVRHSGASVERMVGMREAIGALVVLVGPAAAGTLMGLLDGTTVLWVTAGTSLAAAVTSMLLPRGTGRIAEQPEVVGEGGPAAGAVPGRAAVGGSAPSAAPAPARSAVAELREGWRILFGGDPLLRAVTLLSLVLITVVGSLQGILLPGHFTAIGAAHQLGFVLTALGAGTLLGSGLYAWRGPLVARRTWFVTGVAGTAVGVVVVGSLPPVAALFGGAFVLGAATGLLGTVTGVLMLEGIPERARGRVMGTQNALISLAAPAGMALAALLGSLAGLGAAALAVALTWIVVAAVVVVLPVFRRLDRATPAGSGRVGPAADEGVGT